jgi:hypothetical protein
VGQHPWRRHLGIKMQVLILIVFLVICLAFIEGAFGYGD